jgi:hypothetical protein
VFSYAFVSVRLFGCTSGHRHQALVLVQAVETITNHPIPMKT